MVEILNIFPVFPPYTSSVTTTCIVLQIHRALFTKRKYHQRNFLILSHCFCLLLAFQHIPSKSTNAKCVKLILAASNVSNSIAEFNPPNTTSFIGLTIQNDNTKCIGWRFLDLTSLKNFLTTITSLQIASYTEIETAKP